MKKIYMLLLGTLLSTAMYAQEAVAWHDLYSSVVFRGGYNVLEKQPVATVDFLADIGLIRVELELGYAFQKGDETIPVPVYFSPAVGVAYGSSNIVYFLVGGQPFISKTITKEGTSSLQLNYWHLKLEGGIDIRLSDFFFINLNAAYLIPRKDTETVQYFQSLSFTVGLGINL